jgi:putative ABC transport system permease protein
VTHQELALLFGETVALYLRLTATAATIYRRGEMSGPRRTTLVPLYEIRTMDDMLGDSIARQRLSMLVFVMFAAVAVTLASVGLYGVVAHGVTERMHEIGVRIALGAEQRHVLGMVIRQGLSMALVGTAIGVGGALALSR